MLIYPIGSTKACSEAVLQLQRNGFSFTDHPAPEITHLLLDVPSFSPTGLLRSGENLGHVLSMLPPSVCVIGGNLDHPMLSGYRKMDLLCDPMYLGINAGITADCALRLAGSRMNRTFSDTSALVIGWGRIGKCLAEKLRALGCSVTVAARKPMDRGVISALGYSALPVDALSAKISAFQLIFNTVPAFLPIESIPDSCTAVELASSQGLPALNSIPARGLPGKMAPCSSGKLIAESIQRLLKEE